MSGHSKWHKIKHQKEATDKKKGAAFTRFAKDISVAARNEKDPSKNAALREAITRAKKANMPQANIDRLLSDSDKPMQSVTYEGFGPGGAAILVETTTDNSNRTLTEIRTLFRDAGGHLGEPGSVRWKFNHEHKPLYTQTLSPTDQEKLSTLLQDLENNPDVTAVYNDAT